MGHTRQQYEDRIRQRLGDFGVAQHVEEQTIPLVLEEALTQLSSDKPRRATQTFVGDGTAFTFDLTADVAADAYIDGWSRVIEVEFPVGERIPVYLTRGTQFTVDDGGIVRLLEDTPATTESVLVRYASPWPYPTDDPADDLIPDLYFQAVVSLAAGRAARGKAVAFARRQTSTVVGTTVSQDAGPLFQAADELERIYSNIIRGSLPDGDGGAEGGGDSSVFMAVNEIDVFGSDILFHSHKRRRG